MRDARKLERDEALKFEVGAFIELISGNTAKNLINVFIADQAVKAANKKFIKENGSPKVEKVGVVGAGTMGRGIAGQTVSKGLNVKLFDDSEAALNKCIDEVKAYQLSKVGKGYITAEEAENVVKRIKLVSKVEDLANEDIVIEAVYEDFAVKSKVFEKLKNAKVLGTNTSSLSVTGLSGAVENPERLCGVHFFNPVAKMPLVEIIKGKNTSNLAVATALSYAMAIGKTPIMVSDCNGFLVNRLLFPYLIAFDNLVNSGVNYEIIDKVMETWGWPLGPAALSDLVGIDVLYHAAIIMSKAYSDRMKFNLNGPTATLFNNKTFGQKSGKGWYEYTKKGDSLKKGKASWTSGKELNYDDIVRDLMKPMQAEAEIMIKQEVVPSYNEINIALINGAGFPPFRGGLDKPLK
jgi:3-hydroxyacyl-CoA dehydrogenase/enoyl-CoA hydratase/3-hydroxybutyryl-CoA epimerase/enoyl-CoA isomerase